MRLIPDKAIPRAVQAIVSGYADVRSHVFQSTFCETMGLLRTFGYFGFRLTDVGHVAVDTNEFHVAFRHVDAALAKRVEF